MDPAQAMYDAVKEVTGRPPSWLGFWFLASPYSKYPHGLEAAYRLACRQRGLLVKAGIPVFSPVVHSHSVAAECGIDPQDHAIWLPAEMPMRLAATGIILLRAESWESSVGMAIEHAEFRDAGKPVVFMDPDVLPPLPRLGAPA